MCFTGQPTLGEAESWEGTALGSNLVLYGPGCPPSGCGQVAGGKVGWVSRNCPLLELLDRSSTCSGVLVALSYAWSWALSYAWSRALQRAERAPQHSLATNQMPPSPVGRRVPQRKDKIRKGGGYRGTFLDLEV